MQSKCINALEKLSTLYSKQNYIDILSKDFLHKMSNKDLFGLGFLNQEGLYMFIHRDMSIKEYHQNSWDSYRQILYILDIIDKCPGEGGGGPSPSLYNMGNTLNKIIEIRSPPINHSYLYDH